MRTEGRPLPTLRQVLDDTGVPGEYVATPFPAAIDGQGVVVTAVLERTAVYDGGGPRRELALLESVEVDDRTLSWIPQPLVSRRRSAERGRRKALGALGARQRGGA